MRNSGSISSRVVFTTGTDPVRDGLVTSLARPSGNLTGISILAVQLVPKRLELLSELIPQARMFALLVNPNNGYTEPMTRDVEDAARAKGLHLTIVKASTESEIETAFANPDPPLGMAPGAGGLDRSVIGWIRRPDPPDGSWE